MVGGPVVELRVGDGEESWRIAAVERLHVGRLEALP